MNSLATAIQRLGLTGTAAGIVTAFGTTVELSRDSTAYTWSGVGQLLLAAGVDPAIVLNAPTIVGALPNGGAMLNACLTSGGMDFSNATNRGLLAASEITDPPEAVTLVEALLAIGIQSGPQWQAAGLEGLPSEADVTVALVQIDAAEKWSYVRGNVVPPMIDAGNSWDEIKAAIAGV